MSITDSDSVLILGAGVSAPFGLSLGGDLIDQIAEAINRETNAKRMGRADALYEENKLEAFRLAPIAVTLAETGTPLNRFHSTAELLINRLNQSTHDTIDDFIVDNPSFSPITKSALCAVLFNQIYDQGVANGRIISFWEGSDVKCIGNYRLKQFTTRWVNEKRNWSHHLINIIRFSVRHKLLSSRVKIITFNYDTVLESILSLIFRDTEKEYGDYAEYIDFAHVHGSFGELPETTESPAALAKSWAEEICVVQESNIPDQISEAREKAKAWVAEAKKVYAVGFAFSGANCRLLGLDEFKGKTRDLFYCNYDGNMGITQSVERIFKSHSGSAGYRVFPAEGTKDQPVSVEDWFASGFAGETPA